MHARKGRALAVLLTVVALLVATVGVACGGSSSETPYPLEPRPHTAENLGGAAVN